MIILSKDVMQTLKKIFIYYKPYKFKIYLLYFFTIISKILELLPAYYIGKIIDLTIHKNLNEIKYTVIILIIIFFSNSVISFIETYLSSYLNNIITFDIKNKVFDNIITLHIDKFKSLRIGDFISRLEGDASSISKFIIQDILNIILSVLTIIVTMYFLITISMSLSIVSIISFPLSFVASNILGKFVKKLTIKNRNYNDNYYSFIQEILSSIREVKLLSLEKNSQRKYSFLLDKIIKNNIKISIASSISNLTSMTIASMAEWIIILYGSWMIIGGKLSIGYYVAFNSYLSKFLMALQGMLNFNINLQTIIVSLSRINDLMSLEKEDVQTNENFAIINGNISLNNVCFTYNDSSETILKNISMDLKPNSISAIVGLSGCGKTTLLDLLVRFYEYNSGDIFIDNKLISSISLSDLRNNIAYIQQEPIIYNGSIKENLLIGNHSIDMEKVIEACKKANIHSFINNLPNKYDTLIGEKGIHLSGGQKQRLAIARAIIKNSKILLLDEITSDLDGNSELFILKTLQKLTESHTILMVAHRLTTILNIPQIFVIENGTIVAEGCHNELINNCDAYKKLYGEQWNNYLSKINSL